MQDYGVVVKYSDDIVNEPGIFVHMMREAKGYRLEDVCDGICSVATMSRIETGKRITDFLVIESLLNRMKITENQYEFILDADDFDAYTVRNEIYTKIQAKQYEKAEKMLTKYEKRYGKNKLHRQFIDCHRAMILENQDKATARSLYHKAICATVPNFEEKMKENSLMSNLELISYVGMIHCNENEQQDEKAYEQIMNYCEYWKEKEGFYPFSYRLSTFYYAQCLFAKKQYELCIEKCSELLEQLFLTTKLENRQDVFLLRAQAKEQRGFTSEEEKKDCLRDYLTAYYTAEFYDGEESVSALRQYIGENFGWQYII